MGQILVRNLDDAVIEVLKRLAASSGTSTEEQARRALARGVGLDREAAADRLRELRRSIGKLPGPSIVEQLRRDRDRDSSP
jgi:plasmid stability protein